MSRTGPPAGTTRSRARVGAIFFLRQTWLPSVITSTPARAGGRRAWRDPTPSAAFSRSPRRSRARAPRGARAGVPRPRASPAGRSRPRRRGSSGRYLRGRVRGPRSTRGSRILRVARERLALDLREVDHGPDLRDRRGHGRPDRERGIRRRWRHAHDQRGCARRLDVDPRAERLAAQRQRRDPDDRAIDRRVDVGAGDAPTSSDAVLGPVALRACSTTAPAHFRRRACWRSAAGAPVPLLPTGSSESAPPPTAW